MINNKKKYVVLDKSGRARNKKEIDEKKTKPRK
jgi:hypothetical protein